MLKIGRGEEPLALFFSQFRDHEQDDGMRLWITSKHHQRHRIRASISIARARIVSAREDPGEVPRFGTADAKYISTHLEQ